VVINTNGRGWLESPATLWLYRCLACKGMALSRFSQPRCIGPNGQSHPPAIMNRICDQVDLVCRVCRRTDKSTIHGQTFPCKVTERCRNMDLPRPTRLAR
jgi:hypothetical protein